MMLKSWIRKSFVLGMSFTLLAPSFSHAYGEAAVIQGYVGRQTTVPLIKPSWGNFILHTETLNKLYSLRGFQAIWTDTNGLPNAMAVTLKNILLTSDRHGLNPGDYWDADVENLYKAAQTNQKNWITFELAASEALIRYVTHLSTGRFDPEQIDTDIKYKQKDFNEYNELNLAVSYGAGSLASALDGFAPSHPRYKDLMSLLVTLKDLKARGGWPTLTSPGFILKRGVKDPIIGQLRARLRQLGYYVSDAGGNTFDTELEDVVKQYQAMNGLTSDGIIGTRSEVLRALNFTVGQRIAQVEVTMEKLRWLPKTIENRHIFVNLATTEFRLFDEGSQVFYFKTINGQAFRRTPSMRDQITFVNLNPYWTVPRSIAIKDKLPLLKQDRRYLEKHNMLLIEEATDEVIDPSTIDWKNMTAKNFVYYIRQLPGPDNALGVVKFPLQNPWAIYLHDTNDKHLFGESKRHLSSGCVRLEQPLELAAYLLRDQPGWSLYDIQNFVPMYKDQQAAELDKRITLKKPMPVYFLYLTVEKGEDGSMRFIDDVYGQDTRLSKALQNKKSAGELF
ncbi:L,D-transpeptidase family protein [Bdellovibrio sp. 22V]|uniref:L,D-transpeptidase family protein n=1 Tax=Bdellovibrio TaxID=958 RepID=UPI0025437C39|nr:L,D-transpeptidase family protein [Bdellovibrio sp. 22V]WII73372.1 L,D-transpeptidase family protein [Bdellovibrio sp. 22V]